MDSAQSFDDVSALVDDINERVRVLASHVAQLNRLDKEPEAIELTYAESHSLPVATHIMAQLPDEIKKPYQRWLRQQHNLGAVHVIDQIGERLIVARAFFVA